MDQGDEVFTPSYEPVNPPEGTTHLQVAGNDPAPTTSLHVEQPLVDEGELITKIVPPKYHDFLDKFAREGTKLMPPHQPYDYTIDLENVQTPPHSHIYLLPGTGFNILWEFLGGILGKGFICTSSSPGGAPILFAKGEGGAFQLCGNFRNLNHLKESLAPIAGHESH